MAAVTKPRQSLQRGWFGRIAGATFIGLSILATYEIRLTPSSPQWGEKFASIVDSRRFPEQSELEIRTRYTGIASFDYGLRFLVAAFLPGAAGFIKEFQVLQAYFLVSFFPIIAIYSVEAGRRGNRRALTYYTTLWALLYQTVGGAIIIPLYCLAFMRDTARAEYYSASSRRLPASYARALIPALLLGFLLPTIALYLPFDDPGLTIKQALIAFWQATPLYVNLLLLFLSLVFDTFTPPRASGTADIDAAHVKSLYGICFFISAAAHGGMISLCLFDPNVSFARAFLPHTELLPHSAAQTLHFIFQWDYLIIFGASLLWACVTVQDLNIMGNTNVSLAGLGFLMVVGSVVCGPAAMVVGTFWWREGRLRKEEKPKVS